MFACDFSFTFRSLNSVGLLIHTVNMFHKVVRLMCDHVYPADLSCPCAAGSLRRPKGPHGTRPAAAAGAGSILWAGCVRCSEVNACLWQRVKGNQGCNTRLQ